jgi:hypothetical protein
MSAHLTGGHASSSLLPTVTSSLAQGGPAAWKDDGRPWWRQSSPFLYLAAVAANPALLPTPSANQYEQDNQVLLERRERERAKGRNGNGFGLTTANAVALLPTPSASGDARNTNQTSDYLCLAQTVNLLPTPRASDGPEKTSHARTWSTTDFNLHSWARLLPTPTTQDGENTAGPSQARRNSLPLNGAFTPPPSTAGNTSSDDQHHHQLTIEDG